MEGFVISTSEYIKDLFSKSKTSNLTRAPNNWMGVFNFWANESGNKRRLKTFLLPVWILLCNSLKFR